MAASQIEEKILGRLARQTAPSNPLLSASLYQVLGLSIMLSRKLYRARKLRKLDITRDTKSLQLYHHIIWLAREGLSITEVYILPYCQDGEQGPECRVMAAKLRASLYHVFCLFHNHPPIYQLSPRTNDSDASPSSTRSPRANNGKGRQSPGKTSNKGRESNGRRRRSSKSALRDPIPSMISEASYVTNPYAAGAASPPPMGPPPPLPPEARRTPTRPPGLMPINIAPIQAAASFLLPPLNFVPMTKEHFDTTQHLATSLLAPAHALRLSVALEHAAFLWDCEKDHDQARKLARKTIKEVYSSTDGLDDDEFLDASALVQALGGIVRRGSAESSPQPSSAKPAKPAKPPSPPKKPQPLKPKLPPIDRTIAISPPSKKRTTTTRPESPSSHQQQQYHQPRPLTRTPDRLSTVPEDPSQEATSTTAPTSTSPAPPTVSRASNRSTSNRSKPRRTSSSTSTTASDKASKRRALEQAEELYRQNSVRSQASAGSRQATPPENRRLIDPTKTTTTASIPKRSDSDARTQALDRREAIMRALEIVSSRAVVQMSQSGKHLNGYTRVL